VTRRLLTGNGAAAWGARLARVDYAPAFPITPQTEIMEMLGRWIDEGELAARLVTLESEHSMVTAAGAAAATGVRVFTATSSQGLLHAMEMLYTVAGWRAPFVLVNVSRGLAAPLTLEPDHQDVLAARDSGFLQIHCATAQEVLDSVLLAYRLAEDARVRLPAIVNLDGFHLSFTREPVEVPEPEAVDRFLPPHDPENVRFLASKPVSQAVAVLGGGPYSYFRYQMHRAAEAALGVYEEVASELARAFGRRWEAVETWRTEDAEVVFLMIGSFATKARDAVDRLRAEGERVGLVRPRLLRPFPAEALRRALAGKRGVAVIDQNLSLGKGGVLHAELASALHGEPGAPPVLASFVGGLGGRDIGAEEFREMASDARRAADRGRAPAPRLLYTRVELRELRKLQGIAHAERHEIAALERGAPGGEAVPATPGAPGTELLPGAPGTEPLPATAGVPGTEAS
jgi:pyruvate ferredoxin oxidoreductase alpha subunit